MFLPFITKKSALFRLRASGIVIIFLIVLAILFFKVVPGGQISYTKNYSQWLHSGKGFIYNFSPAERVDIKSGRLSRLIGDPVYFSVFTPRTFSKVKLTVKYKSHLSSSTPLIEAGVLADGLVWRYDLQPLDNKILDDLKLPGRRLEEQGLTLWQEGNDYNNLEDFFADLKTNNLEACPGSTASCLAVYNYNPDFNFQFKGLKDSLPTLVDIPLRGAHTLFFYVNNEPLRLELKFVDLNQDKAADPLAIILSKDGKVIQQADLADENLNPASGQEEYKSLILEERTLSPGLYKVEIKISDDTVIKSLQSSLDRFVFVGRVWPVSVARSLNIYTDSNYLQAKAFAPASVQDINFGGQTFSLDEPYKQFNFQVDGNSLIKEIRLSKDDVILESGGVFSFNKNMVFNPSLLKVNQFFKLGAGVKYILSDYQEPSVHDGETSASAEFNLVGVYREKGKYNFMISIPGLKNDDQVDDYLEISEIKMEFSGRTIWQKLLGRGK
ncbi:MAG: hypothetical protein WCW61_00240 [Patescibacteria group bacterium]|jgi:hypothetical protein